MAVPHARLGWTLGPLVLSLSLSLIMGACAGDDAGATSSLSGGDAPGSGDADEGQDTTRGDGSGTTAGASSSGSASGSGGGTTAAVDDTGSSGATAGSSGSTSGGTTAGSDAVGCADGEREGFVDLVVYTEIAGCSGGWDVPGVLNTTEPACDRAGGDDGANGSGRGCTVADLCAVGWHVCASALEVDDKSPNGCVGSVQDVMGNLFFATRQSGVGQSACSAGANDFHGCGNIGAGGLNVSCAPLDRTSNNLCSSLPAPWSCAGSNVMEANQVIKPGPISGGVLCCRD